jgi:hypothetical protein
MRLLATLFGFGGRTLPVRVREELEAEGLVLVEERMPGSVRYAHFRAPGRRFHGKITPQGMAIGISEKRVVVYGLAKLVDSEFTSAHLDMVDVAAVDGRVELNVDYDRGSDPKVRGRIRIRAKTPNADAIVRELVARLGR